MRNRRDIILIALAAAAIILAGVVAYRTLWATTPPVPIDPAVREADEQMNEQMQRQAPEDQAAEPARRPSRTPGSSQGS